MFCNFRKSALICVLLLEIAIFSACHVDIRVKKNDTTAALQILLDSAFYKSRLLAAVQPNSSDPLKDTMILKRNNTWIGHLPKSLLYKFLSEDEMCKLMMAHKVTNLQFLELESFVKTSKGYRAVLGTHCLWNGIE